ncbi:uncharacterized protein LOC135693793 [Rhopilema esculentum]|uniref:uncharacterized protein LOC135693793 n=1 Tax=Rhopilema esculentum TaxID=499914 RepID=UPI0031E38B87
MAKAGKWLLAQMCTLICATGIYAAPTLNAHDLIMEVNMKEIAKRNAKAISAEDKILQKNQALGVDLFEGDIKITKEEMKKYYGENSDKRSATIDSRSLWGSRTIPYVITHSGEARLKIKAALDVIMSKVPCLKFREKTYTDSHYMEFTTGIGCWSYIGRRHFSPNTAVSLPSGCLSQTVIIHEVMHALGFFHEQSRPDRDSYVTIFYENINTGHLDNFKRMTYQQSITQDTPYDYKSIMHYTQTTFTRDGQDTMRAKFDPAMPLGNTEMSDLDILELNKLYQCHVSSSAKWSEWTSWTPCMNYGSSCVKLRQRFCMSENRADCPGADSYGVIEETQPCTSCQEAMNGHWNKWGSWGSCSKTCNEGVRTRHRKCDNPAPSNGGSQCPGSSTHTVICRIKRCNQHYYDTSFEDGWGMWQQSQADDGLNWIRAYGPTPTSNTGPEGDHTSHYGYYAYVEAGSIDHGKRAILKSPEFHANSGDKCLSFYYNMNGKKMGTLKVIIRYKSGSSIEGWQKSGHQGNHWNPAAVNLPASTEPYTIEIEGKIGFSPYSDIAIDDVYVDGGKCVAGLETCKDTDSNCQNWAKSGECHKNPSWMLRSCCSSCSGSMGSCTADTYGATQCASFVKNYGCTHNGEWMWANCCKSCKDCLDSMGECAYWASIGECDNNKSWMQENCKLSCKVCKP